MRTIAMLRLVDVTAARSNSDRKRFRRGRAAALLLLLLAVPAWAQPEPTPQLQSPGELDPEIAALAAGAVAQHRWPGLVCGYFESGNPGRLGAAGVRQVGEPAPLQANDLLHLGSCTKAWTALLIALAIEDQKFGWEATIGELLPQLRDQIDPGYAPVTVRQLLSHRGGIRPNSIYLPIGVDVDPRDWRSRSIVAGLRRPPEVPPGEGFRYSNLGYLILGHILETAYGQTWENLVRTRLCEPLRIAETAAGFGTPRTPARTQQPAGHRRDAAGNAVPHNVDNSLVLGPAGTLHCDLPSWAAACRAHLQPREAGGLLRAATLHELHHDPGGQRYAGGWILSEVPEFGGAVWSHTGSNTVWTATAVVSPSQDCIYLAVANLGDPQDSAQGTLDVLKELARLRAARHAAGSPADHTP